MQLQIAPRLSICRPLQNNIILVEPATAIPNKRTNNIATEENIRIIDTGKNNLILLLSKTNFRIKLKNLIVSLIGEIEDDPLLCLYSVGTYDVS